MAVTPSVTVRSTCGVCEAPLLPHVSFGPVPLANDMRPDAHRVPLTLCQCQGCGLVQIAEHVDPQVLFPDDYPYRSAVSAPFVTHALALVDECVERLSMGPGDLACEIGSNDGTLLARYLDHGVKVHGWEPAGKAALEADARGVGTTRSFFDQKQADWFKGHASVVHLNNVLAHVPDPVATLTACRTLLAPGGMVVIETPHVRPLLDGGLFDTIYHEHRYYWDSETLDAALRRAGLVSVAVQAFPDLHGGSFRTWARRQEDDPRALQQVPGDPGLWHRGFGVTTDDLLAFHQRTDRTIARLRHDLLTVTDQGGTVAGFGAAAKGAMLLAQLRDVELDFVVDATPAKWGRTLGGTDSTVIPPDRLRSPADADVCVILAWNFADAVLPQLAGYIGQGGRVLVPLPVTSWVGEQAA